MADLQVHGSKLFLLIIVVQLIAKSSTADARECTKSYTRFQNGTYLYEGNMLPTRQMQSINCVSETPGKLVYSLCKIDKTMCVALCMERFKILEKLCIAQKEVRIEEYKLEYSLDYNTNWRIGENGSLYSLLGNGTKRCYGYNDTGADFQKCPPPDLPLLDIMKAWAMFVSLPFLFATILVYALTPQLLNLHGKCLICYLISLLAGYTGLVTLNLFTENISKLACQLLGFTLLFVLLSAFFWLSVISFDLWRNFRGTSLKIKKSVQKTRFYVYSLYAWGMPIVITVLSYLAEISGMPEMYRPGINGVYCWINTEVGRAALIYFYGPDLILIVFIVAMYILVAYKIYMVRKGLRLFAENDKNSQHLQSQRDNFWLFFRLFIIMGVSWMFEVLSYLCQKDKEFNPLFAAGDFYNAMQGIIVFILLVMRPKVLRLIKQRFKPDENQSDCKYKLSSVSSESGSPSCS